MPLTVPDSRPPEQAAIHARQTTNGRGLMLEVIGKFNWSQSQVFSSAYNREQHYDSYMVDMKKCTQVTPSGICALLLLKEFTDKHHCHLQLANTNMKMARQIRHADLEHQLSDTISVDPSSVLIE